MIGPMLFLLFVNDVIDIFDNFAVSFKLYADDIKLYYCYNITSFFYDSVAIVDIANLSVCLSVCYVPVSDENSLTYRHSFFTIR